jgi:anti-sigma factor RsiW
MFAQQQTEQSQTLNENEMRYWSDLEVELLIDEVSEAALEAIEQAAGEAARAAVLAMLEREAEALREAQRWRLEAETAKRKGFRNAIITGVVCFLGGFATGILITR